MALIEHSLASMETHAIRSARGSKLARVFSAFVKNEHIWLVPLIKDKPSFADNSTPINPFSLTTWMFQLVQMETILLPLQLMLMPYVIMVLNHQMPPKNQFSVQRELYLHLDM